MQRLTIGLAALAAVIFIAVSATMNSLFLSSIGRTSFEASLFAGTSLASDLAKAILPVALARALSQRLWLEALVAAALLAATLTLSLASGMGFAATTRATLSATRQVQIDARAAISAELSALEQRRAAVGAAREIPVIEADLHTGTFDRRWLVSASCSVATERRTQQFCTEIAKLKGELAAARERAHLAAEADALRKKLNALGAESLDSDPQAAALAQLLGIGQATLRSGVTFSLAVVLELGSVGLILIASGQALKGPQPPLSLPEPKGPPATIPMQADRRQWQRQRAKRNGLLAAGGADEQG